MYNTKVIEKVTKLELEKGVPLNASWHQEYKDSAYIFVGGLNYGMNEGDIATVFSQYGELVDVRLMRDKKTGKSKGFCYIAYVDQRSTVLAVDNFNGIELCGRTIRVDHVHKFKPPKEFLEVKEDPDRKGRALEEDNEEEKIYKPSGPDGRGWGEYRQYTEEELQALEEAKEQEEKAEDHIDQLYDELREKKEKIIIDEDERWERKLMHLMEEEDEAEREKKAMLEQIKKQMKKRRKLEKKLKKDGEKKKKKDKSKKEKKERKEKEKEERDRTPSKASDEEDNGVNDLNKGKVKKISRSRSRSKSSSRSGSERNRHDSSDEE